MRKILFLFACLVLFLFACFVMIMDARNASAAGIIGSDHDLTSKIAGLTNACIVCHTPHNAQSIPDAPLSNRTAPTGPYTLYSSSTLDATMEQPGGSDLMCLSCHDGTMALDSYGGKTGSQYISGGANLSTNLSNDHPVSFNYPNATMLDSGLAKVTDSKGTGIAPFKLFGSYVRCSTCHDVHDSAGHSSFLRATNNNSFCKTCHINK